MHSQEWSWPTEHDLHDNPKENSLHFSGPSIWNNLDEELKSLFILYSAMTKHFLSTANTYCQLSIIIWMFRSNQT